MKRLLQFRILIVLIALALIPAAILPFAERLRTEWSRFWEPKEETLEEIEIDLDIPAVSTLLLMEEEFPSLTVPVEPIVELPDA